MKKYFVLLLYATFLQYAAARAQCPPGAFAYLSTDQTCASGCSVLLLGWPQGTTVNIYGGNPLRTISSVPIPGAFGSGRDSSAYTCVPCNVPLVFASVAPGSTSGCVITTIGVLPIRYARFTAAAQADHSTLLSWTTGTETAPIQYTIQKSTDGTNFSDVANVNGTQHVTNTYSYADRSQLTQTAFYRIKGKEISGKVYYSEVAIVKSGASFGVSIYPNPASGDFKVTIPANYLPANLQVINAQGATVFTQVLKDATSSINRNLPKGVYQLKLVGNNNATSVQRLIKN